MWVSPFVPALLDLLATAAKQTRSKPFARRFADRGRLAWVWIQEISREAQELLVFGCAFMACLPVSATTSRWSCCNSRARMMLSKDDAHCSTIMFPSWQWSKLAINLGTPVYVLGNLDSPPHRRPEQERAKLTHFFGMQCQGNCHPVVVVVVVVVVVAVAVAVAAAAAAAGALFPLCASLALSPCAAGVGGRICIYIYMYIYIYVYIDI